MAESHMRETNRVYVDTSLDTHLLVLLHDRETISDFKVKLCKEHHLCFPELGEIDISAVKVNRQNTLGLLFDYHLPDSVLLSMVFNGIGHNCWFVFVDAAVKVPLENCLNHELLEKEKNDYLLLDGYTLEEDLEADKTTKKRELELSDGDKSFKKQKFDLNQSSVAAAVNVTSSEFDVDDGSHELSGNVQLELVATESSPRKKLADTLPETTRKDTEMGEKSVEDVGRVNVETDNLVSHQANHLDSCSGLATRSDTEKRSQYDINQSSAAAFTTSNVDSVAATPESLPASGGENLDDSVAEATQKENELVENSVDDVGRDQTETDNLVSHTANHLDNNSELTTRPDTEKKKRRKKRSKDQSRVPSDGRESVKAAAKSR